MNLREDSDIVSQMLMEALPKEEFWMVELHESGGYIEVTLNRPLKTVEDLLRSRLQEGTVRIKIDPDLGVTVQA